MNENLVLDSPSSIKFSLQAVLPISFIIFFFNTISFSQTIVPGGNVYGNWALTGSPYIINGSIQVPNDSTLIIEPGVTVSFQGTYKFLINGCLLAIGTPADSIKFTASDTAVGWRGIRFINTNTNNDTSKFVFCKIQYGKAHGVAPEDKGGGMYFENYSKVFVSNSVISNCSSTLYGGGIYCYASNPVFYNNFIGKNIAYYGGGIYITSSSPLIIQNTINNNSATIVNGQGGGIHCLQVLQ